MSAPLFRPAALPKAVDMTHGAGGKASAQLVSAIFQRHFSNPALNKGDDGAVLHRIAGRLVLTCDGHVVSPLFFPGGDIGSLSVHGTINDLAVMGAAPVALTAGFIIEEGFSIETLETIVVSMAKAAAKAGVPIVTGDTKVVGRGQGDGVYITVTGLGTLADELDLSGSNARPGDVVIVSGTIGDHGIAVLSKRENLEFETEIRSDSQSLHELAQLAIKAAPGLRLMRDPTRGGLSATLNEIAHQSGVGMALDENNIPVKADVKAACELLGLDPVNIANEGKLIAICAPEDGEALLAALRSHDFGREAAMIGTVVDDKNCIIRMKTVFGGSRVMDWIAGEQLPRIC